MMTTTNKENVKDYAESAFDQGEQKLKGALHEAERTLRRSQEQLGQLAGQVNKQVHDNPWAWVAGVGVGCLLLGIIVGKSKS